MDTTEPRIKISDPKDLSLDNLVFNRHGEIHAIRRQDFAAFDHPDMGGDYGLYAIALTPEIFEKCGFEVLESIYYNNDKPDLKKDYQFSRNVGMIFISFGYAMTEEGVYIYSGLGDPESYGFKTTPIKYVHQLQNLFFALTGEELKIDI